MALSCHVPIRVRVVGVPDEEALGLLSRRVAAQVRARLAAARRELPAAPAAERHREVHERYDPDRDAEAGYELPSYDGGAPTQVPIRTRRSWIVLRAVDFRTTVGDFLDAVERVRAEELPARVLYDERAGEERWVELWWVQVNVTTQLSDVEVVLNQRARELARLGPRQILTDLISPFDNAWEELVHLDRTGVVRTRIPMPGTRNARRVQGNGPDAVISHGGWLIYAFMALPGVAIEDVLDVGTLTQVRIPMDDAGFLVDKPAFAHQWSLDWDRFAEEFATEEVLVWLLGARVKKRLLAQAAYYLIGIAAEEQRLGAAGTSGAALTGPAGGPAVGRQPGTAPAGSAPAQEALIGEGIFVLTPEFLGAAPASITRHARTLADPPAPAGVRAARDVPLMPSWPVLFIHLDIPLDQDRIAAAKQGPTARRIAAAMRELLAAGASRGDWVWKMWGLLDEANAGGPPEQRPPGGTLAEHVLADLERTGDFTRLYDSVDETRYFGLRAWLLALSLPTKYGDHPRVQRLHDELAAARAATFRNDYLPDEAILLDRRPSRRWAVGGVLGDLASLYVISRDIKRVKDEKLKALKTALVKHRVAVLGEIATGKLPREMDDEEFARESLARALTEVPIGKDDIEEVTIERSMKLLGVRRRDINGLPSYDLRLAFVERVKGGTWAQAGNEFLEQNGDFEARLIAWELGKVGEFYETFGLAVTVVALVLVAWEIGLIGVLVDAAGGGLAVAISITVSELIWLLRVAFGDEKFTLRGFLMAALDGYLMALGFRLGGILGEGLATRIGTATVRRVIAGWIAERLVAGVVGGAVSAGLERFAHDVLAVATGEGSWSGIGDYVNSMAFGAVVGVVAEFTIQPALKVLLAGGRTALESSAELVAKIRAEGWSSVQFSAGVTEALANMRASLTTLAGDAAAKGFATALAERLEVAIRELGSSAIATRVLELSGAKFTREATEGLQRFLKAADAARSPARAHELARIFSEHPQETIYFFEALSTMESDAARHLVAGTFGRPQELAAFLGRIGRYEPAAQRAVVKLLGELGIVVADPIAALTPQEVLQRQLALSLRLQAEGDAAEVARLRGLATRARAAADVADAAGNPKRAAAKRAAATRFADEADVVEARGTQARKAAVDIEAGGGPAPADVIPTDAEVDAALTALESGTSATGGPQAWVRLPLRAVRGNAPVLERLVRPLFRSRTGNRVVFRTEGGVGASASRSYVNVDAAGKVRLNTGGKALNLNFGVFERAVEFLLENRAGARLKVFEVEEGWFEALRGVSTPEQGRAARLVVTDPATGAETPLDPSGEAPGISDVTGLPRIVDTRYGLDQLQVPATLVPELQDFIVPGTGRVLEFTP